MTATFHDEPEFRDWADAIDVAKTQEDETGKRRYVVKIHGGRWCVTEVEPYADDEWYTADGIRGGE